MLVDNFLKEKISFNSIYHCIKAIFKDRDFNKYAVKKVKNVKDIYKVDQWARKNYRINKINLILNKLKGFLLLFILIFLPVH